MSRVDRVSKRGTRSTKAKVEPRDLNRAPLDLARCTYLTVTQAAEYLQVRSGQTGEVSLAAMRGLIRRKEFPAWCFGRRVGRQLRFVRARLDEWMQERREDRQGASAGVHAKGSQVSA